MYGISSFFVNQEQKNKFANKKLTCGQNLFNRCCFTIVCSYIRFNPDDQWYILYKTFNLTGFASARAATRHYNYLRHMLRINAQLCLRSVGIKEQTRRHRFGIRIQVSYYCNRFLHHPLYPAQRKSELQQLMPHLSDDIIANPDVPLREYLMEKIRPHAAKVIADRLRIKYQRNDIDILRVVSFKELYRMMHIIEKAEGKIESRKGTVVGYFPASKEYHVLFDDTLKIQKKRACDVTEKGGSLLSSVGLIQMELDTDKDWMRIPWDGTVLDTSNEGEHCVSSILPTGMFEYGPNCPRCFAHLGVGMNAWEICSMCNLTNPGSTWSDRLHKSDENAWIQPVYAEELEPEETHIIQS